MNTSSCYYSRSSMAVFSRKNSTLGALFIAAFLVVGAYFFSTPGLGFFGTNLVNAQSTQDLLKAYASKDTDGDGLPDWEEALYGTDPNNAHSVSASMTDGQAVAQGLVKPKFSVQGDSTASSTPDTTDALPGTEAASGSMTDQFARDLFTQTLSQSDGTQPSADQISALAQSAIQNTVQQHASTDTFNLTQEKISGSGSDALVAYAIAAEKAVSLSSAPTTKNEIDFFSDAMATTSNQSDIQHLKTISSGLTQISSRLMLVPVPIELQQSHLAFVNELSRLAQDVNDMSFLNTDPLRAYIGLSAYQNDSAPALQSVLDIRKVFDSEIVSIPDGQPGGTFYHLIKMNSVDSVGAVSGSISQ
jgi:hypothetical protein